MTTKVKFFDKRVIKVYGRFISFVSTVFAFILIFIEIPNNWKNAGMIIFAIFLILIYIAIWIYANQLTDSKLNIEGSTVHIKTGDIFNQEGLKVIPFNEYFDTQVDDRIISEKSLNGQYILKNHSNYKDLNKIIKTDGDLNEKENVLKKNINREGNSTKYRLGSTIVVEDYVLTAFTKFSKKNKAQLTMYQYLDFLIYFWDEINRVYAQNPVSVPIFGSGITRFKGGFEDIDDNELLNIMIWTFKVSKIKFEYPAKLTIIIHEKKIDKINLFKLKELEK